MARQFGQQILHAAARLQGGDFEPEDQRAAPSRLAPFRDRAFRQDKIGLGPHEDSTQATAQDACASWQYQGKRQPFGAAMFISRRAPSVLQRTCDLPAANTAPLAEMLKMKISMT
jgi:hypothetical protein